MRERLNNWEFQSPPPFVPRKPGRKRKATEGMSVFVGNVKHTLVHALTLNIWKKAQGRCVCCYARAPPVPKGKHSSKKFMSNGMRIPQTNFACDICQVCTSVLACIYVYICHRQHQTCLTYIMQMI